MLMTLRMRQRQKLNVFIKYNYINLMYYIKYYRWSVRRGGSGEKSGRGVVRSKGGGEWSEVREGGSGQK